VILPPTPGAAKLILSTALGATLVQAVPSDAEWWKVGAGGLIGFLSSLVVFRTRLYGLKRDIDAERDARLAHERSMSDKLLAVEERIAESVGRIEQSIVDRQNSDVAAGLRDEAKSREALNAIRRDNDENHKENRERFRIMRQQLFAVVQLIAKIARAIPGINQDDVDLMMVRVHSAEVERAD
jgi:Mg2+ and Co2+ transporter CorA